MLSSSPWSSIPLLLQIKRNKRNVDKRKVVPPKNVPQILFPDLGSGLKGDAEEDQGKSRTRTQVFDGEGMDLINLPIFGGS